MSDQLTDERIEALALEHEAFGFGLVDTNGLTTHGFDPDGLAAFARAVAEEAVRLEREACAVMFDDSPNAEMFRQDIANLIRSRSKEGS